MTTVSIAMATFNGARFLAEQLASFAAQTRLPDELVVCDDLSTDETIAVVEGFAASAPFPVRIERNRVNLGLHRNFERALSRCSGDLILISDQDDIWYPDKIDAVVAAFDLRPDILALHHDEHILDHSSGRKLAGTLGQRTRRLGGWDRVIAAGNCTALRRSALELVLRIPEGVFYDDWINALPDALGARLVLDRPLQLWRRHGLNSSLPSVADERPSRLALHWRYGLSDPRPGWTAHESRLKDIRKRITDKSNLVDRMLGNGRARQAINRLTVEIERVQQRIALASLPKPRRWARVITLWRGGFYSGFSGWRSALKDAVVP